MQGVDVEAEFGPRLAPTVVMATSEDDGFPASALERHSARTRGWHTGKMPEFPVELGFAFDGLAEIRCIRLLAHESKIPNKVDLYVFTPSDDQVAAQAYPDFMSADFRRLGYMSFLANDTNQFCARELKTVRIKARVLYLKLIIRGCHANGVNLFNQAGLVGCDFHGSLAVPFPKTARQMILGLPVSASYDAEVELTDLTPAKAPSSATGATRKRIEAAAATTGDTVPPAPSSNAPSTRASRPGSAMARERFDQVTAQRIRQLTLHKAKAVSEEDYDLAKALKEQIDALSAVGEKIFELEERKKAAVEQEDYDVAKMLKRQIDDLRNPVPKPQHQPAPSAAPPPVAAAAPPADPYYPAASAPPRQAEPEHHAAGNDDVPVGGHAAPPPPPVPYDERPAIARGAPQPAEYPDDAAAAPPPAPAGHGNDEQVAMAGGAAAANADTGGIVVASKPAASGAAVPTSTDSMAPWERQFNQVIVSNAGDEEPHAPPLDAPKVKEYQVFTDTFGLYCCSCLFAKRWQLRDAAMRAIVSKEGFQHLTSGVRPPNQGSAAAVLQQLLNYLDGKSTGVNDTISQAFFTVCDVIKVVVSDELAGAPVVAAVQGLSSLLPALMLKAGDSNQRVREKAQATLFMLAMSPVGAERVSSAALHDPQQGVKKPLNYRVHSARLSLVRTILTKLGLNRKDQRTGLTAETVTNRLCIPLLSHASGDVRDAAVHLIVALHDHVPVSVMSKLLVDVKPAQKATIDELLGDRGKAPADGAELASSSIAVEKGGNHAVLDAARQAKRDDQPAAAPAAAAPAPAAKSGAAAQKARQEEEREAQERAAKTCQFCGKYDARFTDEILDVHYARSCPMLIPCPLCEQVTEIPMLQQHLIAECTASTGVKQCPTCREAVPVEEFDTHVTEAACIPFSTQYYVCPLCHEKLPPTDQGWDDHLLKAPGCSNNPRRYDGGAGEEFR